MGRFLLTAAEAGWRHTCRIRVKTLPVMAVSNQIAPCLAVPNRIDPGGGDAMFIVAPYSRDFGWSSSWTRPRPERPLLGRLVALAKASAESLVEWLAGEGVLGRNPAGWKKAFR